MMVPELILKFADGEAVSLSRVFPVYGNTDIWPFDISQEQ